jgi:homoserine kinase
LADIKQCLYDAGAHYAALSGSGSSLFALFGPNETPTRLAETLATTYPNCRTITYQL